MESLLVPEPLRQGAERYLADGFLCALSGCFISLLYHIFERRDASSEVRDSKRHPPTTIDELREFVGGFGGCHFLQA